MAGRGKIVVRVVLWCLAALLVLGCAPKNPAEGASVLAELNFLDSFSFDRKLSASLGAGQQLVEVFFPATITLNNIPERMDKWLSKVEKFGGTVEIQAEQEQARGFVSEILGFFVKLYEMAEEGIIYAPAKNYNVLIHYKASTGIITRMSFLRKPAPAPVSGSATPLAIPSETAPQPAAK